MKNSYKLVIVWSPLDRHFCEWKSKVSGKRSIEKEKRVNSRARSRKWRAKDKRKGKESVEEK